MRLRPRHANPKATFSLVLRDRVAHLYSHYRLLWREGWLPAVTLGPAGGAALSRVVSQLPAV